MTIILSPRILVATDSPVDAALVKKMITVEYHQVYVSTNPELVVEDFENRAPDILVLAFNSLEKAERYYLGLYRRSEKIHALPHRTIILCKMEEVSQVYKACKKLTFDDYILFWPMTHDAPRLLMSLHHALRDLRNNLHSGADAAGTRKQPTTADFAAQVRGLSGIGERLDHQMVQAEQRLYQANRAIQQAENEIGTLLDNFSHKLTHGELAELPKIENAEALQRAIEQLKLEGISQRFRTASEAMQPIQTGQDEMRDVYAPFIESAASLGQLAADIRPIILMVDDDEFQHRIATELLDAKQFQLVTASGGIEALATVRKLQPDVILMDIMMPDMDGIETTRRMKTMPWLAQVPIIMVTGSNDAATVRDSLKAGAINFLVKPFDRTTLLSKVSTAMNIQTPASS